MKKSLLALSAVALCLSGCNKSSAPAQNASSAPMSSAAAPTVANDAVQDKLKELAGSGAVDCGRHEIQASNDELKKASDCALDASKAKKAFYVGYDMPGMTTAVAGNGEGKLFAVDIQGAGTGAHLESGPCPADLRVASSGRVTCFKPGSMSLGSGGPDPHAGMAVNPSGKPNPHSGLGIPEPMAPPPSANTRKN